MGLLISYNIQYRHYIIHTNYGEFKFKKYDMGLPYPDAKKQQDVDFLQNFWGDF